MAFDAGMLACALSEIRRLALGARIEKVYQPERDEIVLAMRSLEGGKRLSINAGSGNSRIGFTEIVKENPQNPPMFCMLLRKYLQGAKLTEVSQVSFDRVAYLGFDTRDEMGFPCRRYLIVELMGRYSNIIFADGDKKRAKSLLGAVEEQIDPQWNFLRGRVYLEEGLYREAARCLHIAETRYPKETAPLLERCYRELQDYKRAYEYACMQK